MKIVDRGEMVVENEQAFINNSRLPDAVALDLRAQIGAINVTRDRLNDLLDERGEGLVADVMCRSIDLAERQVRDFVHRLPDGEWTGEAYMDGVRVGDERICRVALKLICEGDTLRFDYTGTSVQVDAAANSTLPATVAGSAVPLYSFLCQGDIDWNDGLKRCIEVVAPEGSVTWPTPAPVSISTVGFRWLVTVAATQAVANMFRRVRRISRPRLPVVELFKQLQQPVRRIAGRTPDRRTAVGLSWFRRGVAPSPTGFITRAR